MARLLILRERQAAEATARLVLSAGHEPVLLPLQTIVPLAPPLPLGPFGALIATSGNAFRSPALAPLRDLPVLAVGRATAEAARAAGFAAQIAGEGTGASLAGEAAEAHASTGRPLLYAAGRVRTDGLERALSQAGVPFETVETYDTRDASPDPAALDGAFAAPIDAVLLLSLGQARAWRRLLADHPRRLPSLPVPLCLSQRIREGLGEGLAENALVSARPELSALLARYGSPSSIDR